MAFIPRCEHPRPDRMRDKWLTLNGEWDFEIDNARVGLYKKFFERESLNGKITVPFCPESSLSGVQNTDFMNGVWYTREFSIPKEWDGLRVVLHIDASNYHTEVFINGKSVGEHDGGYTSFSFDITENLKGGANRVSIYAESDVRSGKQLAGKQSTKLESFGCFYTRTTGIWQSVWLEAMPAAHTVSYKAHPNISDGSVGLSVLTKNALGANLTVVASYEGREVGRAACQVNSAETYVDIKLSELHLWELGKGRLYDLKFLIEADGGVDELSGYFGLREVSLTKDGLFRLNGRVVFGRFVLDQGFYPDGIITAPSDEALVFDIEASMSCGFNGARLHQKVFEPRFLYHADRLGYMVWAETGNWGWDHTDERRIYNFLPEWLEELERDFSHPSIIGWCPTNETWERDGRQQSVVMLDTIYDVTRAIDKTRPIITSSGSLPTKRTDAHDVHDYEQDPEKFRSYYAEMDKGILRDQLEREHGERQTYRTDVPVFVSEYGGCKWVIAEDESAWGYGEAARTESEFFERLSGLTDTLLENDKIFAFCYTQLTDVEQEQNGLLTYSRKFKFPPERYRAVFAKKSVIED